MLRLAGAFSFFVTCAHLIAIFDLLQDVRVVGETPVAAALLDAPVFPERERIEPCPKKSIPMRDEVLGTFQFTPRCAYSGAPLQD